MGVYEAKEIFAKRMTESLKNMGKSWRWLQEEAEVSAPSISNYRWRKRLPAGDIIVRIAEALNVNAGYLLGDDIRQNFDLECLDSEEKMTVNQIIRLLRRRQ